jgi:hypothetical protein
MMKIVYDPVYSPVHDMNESEGGGESESNVEDNDITDYNDLDDTVYVPNLGLVDITDYESEPDDQPQAQPQDQAQPIQR